MKNRVYEPDSPCDFCKETDCTNCPAIGATYCPDCKTLNGCKCDEKYEAAREDGRL